MHANGGPDIGRFSTINNIIHRKDAKNAKKSANKNKYTTLRSLRLCVFASLRLCGETVTLRMEITC
jgi:hypothetical protein